MQETIAVREDDQPNGGDSMVSFVRFYTYNVSNKKNKERGTDSSYC